MKRNFCLIRKTKKIKVFTGFLFELKNSWDKFHTNGVINGFRNVLKDEEKSETNLIVDEDHSIIQLNQRLWRHRDPSI